MLAPWGPTEGLDEEYCASWKKWGRAHRAIRESHVYHSDCPVVATVLGSLLSGVERRALQTWRVREAPAVFGTAGGNEVLSGNPAKFALCSQRKIVSYLLPRLYRLGSM